MWIVREGYEGLVRGNEGAKDSEVHKQVFPEEVKVRNPDFIPQLRFGDGALLRDGTGDFPGRRSLLGRYIVRVGFDDVRGWMSEVSTLTYLRLKRQLLMFRRVEHSLAQLDPSHSAHRKVASPPPIT